MCDRKYSSVFSTRPARTTYEADEFSGVRRSMHAPMQRMSLQPVTTNSTPVLDSWMPNDDPQFVGADESLQLLSQQLFLATYVSKAAGG